MTRLTRFYNRLINGLGLFAGVLFALMTLGIAIDVALRNLAGSGVGWLIEVAEYAMPVATLLAAPWVLREGGHATVDLLVSRVPAPVERAMRVSSSFLGLVICLTVGWYGWRAMVIAADRGSLVFKAIVFPEWWILALVPLGMGLLALEFARLLLSAWRRSIDRA